MVSPEPPQPLRYVLSPLTPATIMPARSKCKRRSVFTGQELAVALKSLCDLKQAMMASAQVDENEADSDSNSEAEERASNQPYLSMEGLLDRLLPMMEAKLNGPQVCHQFLFLFPYSWLIFLTVDSRILRSLVWPPTIWRNSTLCEEIC